MPTVPVQIPASNAASANRWRVFDPGATRKLGALRSLRRKIDAKDPRLIREAAALLTSQLFFAPLLAEMRKLPFGRELGNGGRGEEVFGEQLDLHLADAIARSDDGLTARLTERLTRGAGAEGSCSPGPSASWPAGLPSWRQAEDAAEESSGPQSGERRQSA